MCLRLLETPARDHRLKSQSEATTHVYPKACCSKQQQLHFVRNIEREYNVSIQVAQNAGTSGRWDDGSVDL